ncbi:MAG: enoyl-CoA hydratase/isomerase family protein [Gammaproteobacteria bacterium]
MGTQAGESTPSIQVRRDGATGVVTISNPARRNAFTPDMRRALTAALNELAVDSAVRAIVLRGDGEHFCSGADVSSPSGAAPRTLVQHRENNKEINRLTQALAAGPKPVIAAVEGAAAGAGMGMVCACDVIVAARNAKLVPLFSRLGLVPEIGILYTLAQRIGVARARRLLMSSRALGAEEAYAMGIVDELVEPGQALARALEISREYEDCVPLSVALIKEAYAAGVPNIAEAGRIEADFVPLLARTDDMREGMAASREKRKPKFTGY